MNAPVRFLVVVGAAFGLGVVAAQADAGAAPAAPAAATVTNAASAPVTTAEPTVAALLERLRAQRAPKDFALKARLFVTREEIVPLDILVRNRPDEARTLYRAPNFELLVIQPDHAPSRFYVRGKGELTGEQRREHLLGSLFTYYDLGLDFLHWTDIKLIGADRHRAQDCWVLEARAPDQPYPRVKFWVHRDAGALLLTESYDRDDRLVRRFEVTSIRKVGELWVPRGMKIGVRPPAQALPSEETSRLEVYDGRYDVENPKDLFEPGRF